ncbi:MAG: HD domain-containing protein [Flavobacteriaceae bacterium]
MIEKTISFVKEKLRGAEAGHDWFHIERVYKNALLIAKDDSEADLLVVQLGALLHDIADSKFHGGDEQIGPQTARKFLSENSVDEEVIEKVIKIIENISFKGGIKKEYTSRELDIVQDADRLDAIGAIGIARTFNYGGFKNRELYNPEIKPNPNMTKEEYKNSTAPTINHFYEKLLLLKDKMNTSKGKELAQKRHQFMESFLEQFYEEWNGEL